MFHKRLMQEFRDNMKYVAGMVATQWLMLIANVFFMYTLAGFISSAADGTAKTADLQKIFIVLACVIAVRAVRKAIRHCFGCWDIFGVRRFYWNFSGAHF